MTQLASIFSIVWRWAAILLSLPYWLYQCCATEVPPRALGAHWAEFPRRIVGDSRDPRRPRILDSRSFCRRSPCGQRTGRRNMGRAFPATRIFVSTTTDTGQDMRENGSAKKMSFISPWTLRLPFDLIFAHSQARTGGDR